MKIFNQRFGKPPPAPSAKKLGRLTVSSERETPPRKAVASGGLGHLGIQFARHMGFHTVAIGRGSDKEKLAKDLGAHVYIDTAIDDAALALQRMGGAGAILATAPSGGAMGPLVTGLSARGKLIVVGVPQDQIQLSAFPLVFGGRSIYGSLAGTAIDTEDALAFSVLESPTADSRKFLRDIAFDLPGRFPSLGGVSKWKGWERHSFNQRLLVNTLDHFAPLSHQYRASSSGRAAYCV